MSTFFVAAFVLLATLLITTLVIGLILPENLAKKWGETPSRKKIAGYSIAWFLLLSVIWLIFITNSQTEAKTPLSVAVKPTQAEVAPPPPTADADLLKFITYHKQLVAVSDKIGAASKTIKSAFYSKNPDQFKMYEAANSSYGTYSNAYNNLPDVPELEDKIAQKEVREMSEAFKNSILMRMSGFYKLRKAIDDRQFKPSTMSEIKESTQYADKLDFIFYAKLFTTYEHFKIPSDKIDIENGGVKSAVTTGY